MALNQQKGNMYKWITHTFNIIKGKCSHKCGYCYMKDIVKRELYFDSKELKTDLGFNNFIFVGSSCDMFAEDVPQDWIRNALKYCFSFFGNTYIFQSKNPERFVKFALLFIEYPRESLIFGTTIETDDEGLIAEISDAPLIKSRVEGMKEIKKLNLGDKYFVTIEPIMDFKVNSLVSLIYDINPDVVNIGADSKKSHLPEPSEEKILELIRKLVEAGIEVRVKDNLLRIADKNKIQLILKNG